MNTTITPMKAFLNAATAAEREALAAKVGTSNQYLSHLAVNDDRQYKREPKIGLAAGILFVRRQPRLTHPMIDLGLFRQGAFSGAIGVNLLSVVALVGGLFFVSQYLQLVLALSPLEAGLVLVPGLVAMSTPARPPSARNNAATLGRTDASVTAQSAWPSAGASRKAMSCHSLPIVSSGSIRSRGCSAMAYP